MPSLLKTSRSAAWASVIVTTADDRGMAEKGTTDTRCTVHYSTAHALLTVLDGARARAITRRGDHRARGHAAELCRTEASRAWTRPRCRAALALYRPSGRQTLASERQGTTAIPTGAEQQASKQYSQCDRVPLSPSSGTVLSQKCRIDQRKWRNCFKSDHL